VLDLLREDSARSYRDYAYMLNEDESGKRSMKAARDWHANWRG